MGNSMFLTSVFSVITIEFPVNSDKYIGWAETSVGAGFAIGPAVGSFLYYYLGFMYTFIAIGGILILCVLPAFIFLPSDLNTKVENEDDSKSLLPFKEIRYKIFFKNFRSMFTLLGCTVMFIMLCFTDTILAVHLTSDFGVSD